MSKTAIIIGAGPAGLTAAYELLKRTDIIPIIIEKSGDIGGISKTVNYKGNRMDIGGHRFFSKSDRVMNWWLTMMPLENGSTDAITISYQNKSREIHAEEDNKKNPDKVMLVRKRLSRIYFLRKFFTYPIQLSFDTLKKLGLFRTIGIIFSYLKTRLFPRKSEATLEDFFINRFGAKLYRLFFKDYTEKVWGVPCTKISAEWGAQRIKGVSIGKAIVHAARSLYPAKKSETNDIGQKGTETSLIEKFLYPKFGPGQLWEEVARQVQEMGGRILMHQEVTSIESEDRRVTRIETMNAETAEITRFEGNYFFSSMPVQELIAGMKEAVPKNVCEVAEGLQYRDFITVGVLLRKMPQALPDTWIYIQERDVKVGRLQIFNNWSPYMVKDPETIWVGMEYFCNKEDDFWRLADREIEATAIAELNKMGLADSEDVLDSTVLRMEKTYPAYFGTYNRFEEIRTFTDSFENLFLVGRNGMHKYNNSDHSMLCSMVAVDNIAAGITSKANIWAINTEQEYHEEKATRTIPTPKSSAPQPFPFLVDYLWRSRANRAWWMVGFIAFLLEFIIFKLHYPFANYMPDSYYYLEAAATNADVNMWPVAYSKFLRLISAVTHSDTIVVGLQYFFLQASSLLFLFSLLYLQPPGKWTRRFLLLFVLLNPVPLYIADYISADTLFIGFSLLWITSLLWIIYRPRPWMVVSHAVLLLACFTIRYNAIYYPVISLIAFVLSRQAWKYRLTGIALGAGLVLASFLYTSQKMQTVTGKWQFSAFGGWQLANNALYMYENIPAKDRGPIPARFAKLETMVREHMDTMRKIKVTAEDSVTTRFYLWSPKGPLIQYLTRQYKKDSTTPYFKRWASEGPLYADYGMYLIRKYPMQFIQSFMLPNAVKFAVPPIEFLAMYNMGEDSVGQLAKQWFNYKSLKVKEHNKKDAPMMATTWYPVFSALVNIVFLMGLIGMIALNAIKWRQYGLPQLLGIVLTLWLLNCGFSIFASPVTMRYQLFPILVCFSVGVLMVEKIWKLA